MAVAISRIIDFSNKFCQGRQVSRRNRSKHLVFVVSYATFYHGLANRKQEKIMAIFRDIATAQEIKT
ncbi:MAG: hypothetical protein NWQ28_06305 [Nodularia sp. (in: cyanobacteria)]|nr:hypothetical protein [Nodularia sp. (in: cyanobacteria)]